MINIENKEECCGCTACEAICPRKCISMIRDNEGFLYPTIEKDKCIECKLCEKICPIIGKKKNIAFHGMNRVEVNRKAINQAEILPEAFVCFLKDEQIRNKSTSGGVFTALAQYALQKNGVVCGVILDKNQRVKHAFAENERELEKMRGSKYVQSEQTGIYIKIEEILQKGRTVLYSGTPCQIEGLKAYLGKEYDDLVTVDVFCHGVGSPLYWEKYVAYISEKAKSPIKEIRFREKTYGYNSACLAVYFQNGKSNHRGHDDDMYWSPFSKNIIYRPSCYACAFKTINHASDYSIGDYWNCNGLPKQYKKANGCSVLLCHSEKAKNIFLEMQENMHVYEVDLEKALNVNGGHQPSMLIACPSMPEKRNQWFDEIEKSSVPELVNKYFPLSLKQKIKCLVKPILFKMGILDVVKKVVMR